MSNEIPISRERLLRSTQSAWHAHLADDEHEPNIEMLAAYVDGGLDDAGRRYVARHIAESPRAWALLESLLEPGQQLPFVEDAPQAQQAAPAQSNAPPVTLRPSTSSRGERLAVFYPMAMAASLLLAVTLGLTSWQQSGRREQATAQLSQSRLELARARRSLLNEATAETSVPVFAGSMTPEQLPATIERLSRGATRGPTDVDKSRIDAALAATTSALDEAAAVAPQAALELKIDRVAAWMQAGKLDDADRVLIELESQHGDDPRVKNARGAWCIHKARESTKADSDTFLARAETLLKSATAGEPQAWLNLVELYSMQRKQAEAAAAARKFAETTSDPQVRAAIERHFGAGT